MSISLCWHAVSSGGGANVAPSSAARDRAAIQRIPLSVSLPAHERGHLSVPFPSGLMSRRVF
jgi:hypothetical protein